MKKVGFLMIAGLLLSACGEETVDENTAVEVIEDTEDEHTEAQVNDDLREQAVEMEHSEVVAGEVQEGTPVQSMGEVSEVPESSAEAGAEFRLIAQDGEYLVRNYSMGEVEEGQTATVYGTYDGVDEATGMPAIRATLVDQ